MHQTMSEKSAERWKKKKKKKNLQRIFASININSVQKKVSFSRWFNKINRSVRSRWNIEMDANKFISLRTHFSQPLFICFLGNFCFDYHFVNISRFLRFFLKIFSYVLRLHSFIVFLLCFWCVVLIGDFNS